MMTLSLWYGGICWNNRAQFAEVLPLGTDTQDYFAIELASMESALAEVCTRLKIDPMSVKKLAGGDESPMILTDIFAVAEKIAYYTELFMSMIVGRGI